MTPRPPPCMELNSQNSSSSRITNGRKLISTLTNRLCCVTLVSKSTPSAPSAVAGHEVVDVVRGAERVGGRELPAPLHLVAHLEVEGLFLVVDRRGLDVALVELLERSGGGDLLAGAVAAEEGGGDEGNQDEERDPEPHGAEDLLTFHTPMPGAGRPACPSTLLIVRGRHLRPGRNPGAEGGVVVIDGTPADLWIRRSRAVRAPVGVWLVSGGPEGRRAAGTREAAAQRGDGTCSRLRQASRSARIGARERGPKAPRGSADAAGSAQQGDGNWPRVSSGGRQCYW